MVAKTYRDDAVVLRTQDLGESDRIITLYGRNSGKIRAVAKGVRRPASRFGARLEPFQRVDIQLHRGKNLDVVSQVVTIGSMVSELTADYQKYTVASAITQIIDKSTDEQSHLGETHYLLLLGALHALSADKYPPALILDAFILRSLALSGVKPVLLNCAECGTKDGLYAFDPALGGALCSTCKSSTAIATRPKVLEHLVFLLAATWEPALAADLRTSEDAGKIVRNLLAHQLDANLPALELIERNPI